MKHPRRSGSRPVLTLPSAVTGIRKNRHHWQNREESGGGAWNDVTVPRLQRGASWSATARSLARVGTVAAFVVVAACSSSTSKSSSATTPPTSTSTTLRSDVAAIATAYKAAELAVADAATVPNPDDPRLGQLLLDPFAKQAREVIRGYQLRKLAIRYPGGVEDSVKIDVDLPSVEINGDTAVLEACAVDNGQRVPTTQSTVIDGQPTAVLVKVGMRRDAGRWKLAEREAIQTWQGSSGCVR